MHDDLNHATPGSEPSGARAGSCRPGPATGFSRGWLRGVQWLPRLAAALLWLVLVYGLPLQTLRESRLIAKDELVRLLQTGRPDTATILDAFDRATEKVLFSVAGPYFILGVAVLFLVAHLVAVKRRLLAAERHIQVLRDAVLGVDGVPLR